MTPKINLPIPFCIEMDTDINVLFATFSPHLSMPKYVHLNPNATPTIAQKNLNLIK
jgi:hypothetical protein